MNARNLAERTLLPATAALKRSHRSRAPGLGILCVAVASLTGNLFGAIRTWQGDGVNAFWTNRFNWDANIAPVPGDRLIFPLSAVRRIMTNNFPPHTTFALLQFAGDNYQIYGNSIAVSNNIILLPAASGNVLRTDLRLAEDTVVLGQGFVSLQLTIGGDIDLNGHDLTIANGGEIRLTGLISGTGNITKNSGGLLVFSGPGANTYHGLTVVNTGQLELDNFLIRSGSGGAKVGFTAVPGDLYIGDGFGSVITATVRFAADNQLRTNSDVIIRRSGELSLNGYDDGIGSLTMRGGRVTTGTGTLLLNGQVTCLSNQTASTISGRVRLAPGSREFDVSADARLQVNATISGENISLIKNNPGEMTLAASNRYSGPTYVQGGTLVVTTNGALSPVNLNSVVPNITSVRDATLKLINTPMNAETLWAGSNAVIVAEGSAAWNGPVALFEDTRFFTDVGDTLVLTERVSGPGGIIKNGAGVLRLRGTESNTHSGSNRVNAGTLELYKFLGGQTVVAIPGPLIVGNGIAGPDPDIVRYGGPGQIADTAPVHVSSSGVLLLQTWSDSVGALSGDGAVDLSSGTLTVGEDVTSTNFDGVISGSGAFIKTGLARLTLNGTNTYTGATTVSNGTLLVNGALASSMTTVQPGARLGGTGRVDGVTISSGGTLAPGASSGQLTVQTNLVFEGGTFEVDLNGPEAGAGYDQLIALAAVNLSNAKLGLTSSLMQTGNLSFIILNKKSAGPVVGAFAGLPEGARLTGGSLLFQISYLGGDGNDVVLTQAATPASTVTSLTPMDAGEIVLRGIGLPGLLYTIEASSTLQPGSWIAIGPAPAGVDGLYEFIDLDGALNPARFYRVRSP